MAQRTGLDPVAIWEWGVVERVSTGLLATEVGLQPVGRQMLQAADRIAEQNLLGSQLSRPRPAERYGPG